MISLHPEASDGQYVGGLERFSPLSSDVHYIDRNSAILIPVRRAVARDNACTERAASVANSGLGNHDLPQDR